MAALLVALVCSYLLAVVYSLWINPEVRFWKAAYQRKLAWANQLSSSGMPKLVFIGGSSCTFQIDAGLLTAEGQPSVNMGMHAGMGSIAIAACGLSAAEPRDTIIWALEPGLLIKSPEITPLGYQVILSTGIIFRSGLVRTAIGVLDWSKIPGALRPGIGNISAMLGKALARRPLYRYRILDIYPGGALSTEVRMKVEPFQPQPLHPNQESLMWLKVILDNSRDLGMNSHYLIPLLLFTEKEKTRAIKFNQDYLHKIELTLPVIHDSHSGVDTDDCMFADTSLHLTRDGMIFRTKELADIFGKIERFGLKIPQKK